MIVEQRCMLGLLLTACYWIMIGERTVNIAHVLRARELLKPIDDDARVVT